MTKGMLCKAVKKNHNNKCKKKIGRDFDATKFSI